MPTIKATFKNEYGEEFTVETARYGSIKAVEHILEQAADKNDGLECLQLVSSHNYAFSKGWLRSHLKKALEGSE